FAGGVLWGDCSSRSVEELVRDFLTALGRRWYDPGALQRTVTAEQLWLALGERQKQADGDDRRTLVIVDNVRDLSQLKQLLPHSRTRSRLLAISDGALESAELPIGGSCHVGPLEPEQSLDVFRNVLGDELVAKYRDAFVEVGELCHHLPTLLSSAAQNLAETKTNPRTVLRQLQESADGRGAMGEQLIQAQQLVLESLAPLPAELFALTSLFGEGDWPAGMLAAVALRPLSEVQPALDLLVRRDLLATSGGRYRTNTLFRDLARRRFEQRLPYEREAACHLLARYCLDMAQSLVLAIESQRNLRPLDRHGRGNYEFYGEFRGRLTPEMSHIRQVLDWGARTRSWEIVRRFAYMPYMGLVDPLIWDVGPIYLDLQMTTIHGMVVRPPRQHQPWCYLGLPNGVVGLADGDEYTVEPEDEALVKKVKPLLQHPASDTPELYCSLAAGAIVDGAIIKADLIHSAWIGIRAENLTLVDVDMVGARFVACELSLCVWRGCNASRAALAGSNLSFAILRQVKLRGADLTGADLTGVVLDDVDLRDADLTGANLSGAWLRKVNLLGARLDNVVWAGATHEDLVIDGELLDDVLEEIKAASATSNSQIYGWIPQSRDLSNTTCPPDTFKKADLRASDLLHVSFDQSKMRAADLRAARLDHSTLDRVNLREADLCAASLDETRIDHANLREARLFAASLANACLVGADLRAANLYAACLEYALLYDVDLHDANLHAASLAGTTLYQAKLGGADLANANLTGASLCEVDLSGAVGASGEQLVEQLKQASRLRGSTMPDGSVYDGCFQLVGDLADAQAQGVDTQDKAAIRRFYEAHTHQRSLAEIVLQHLVQFVSEAERDHAAAVAALAQNLAELASHEISDPSQLLAICEQLESAATALPALLPHAQQVIGEARKPILAAALHQIDQQIEQADDLSNAEKQQVRELIQKIGKEAARGAAARGAKLAEWLMPLARIAPGSVLALAPYLTSPLLVESDVQLHVWVAALFAQIYAYIGQSEESRRVEQTAVEALEKIYAALVGEQIDNELISGQLLLLHGKAPDILAFALNVLRDSSSPVAPVINALVEQLNAGN
ncbi:MAG TPA: pentapeptide repeat-containing protein, partial [Roseiflexaceae bacterium]|nr:pentapeptide repeat-containing protein [Roseiflexaceae bacterium]